MIQYVGASRAGKVNAGFGAGVHTKKCGKGGSRLFLAQRSFFDSVHLIENLQGGFSHFLVLDE